MPKNVQFPGNATSPAIKIELITHLIVIDLPGAGIGREWGLSDGAEVEE
jgi:hypothetical protein